MIIDPILGAERTLVGLGAVLAGIGGLMSGWAALRAARDDKENEHHAQTVEGSSADVGGPDPDGG